MKKGECGNNCSYAYSGAKIKCTEHLVRFWNDLYDDQVWRYPELGPVELLKKAKIQSQIVSENELDRANWFWRRRPRVLSVVGWFMVAIAALVCVMLPFIGAPVLLTSIALVLVTIVRFIRWRREYELSVDRIIRTSGNGSATFDCNAGY
jgi:fatty acid desaturase